MLSGLVCLHSAYSGIYSKKKEKKKTRFNQKTKRGRRMRILWVSFMLNLLSHSIPSMCFKRGSPAGRVAMGTWALEGGQGLFLLSRSAAWGRLPNLTEFLFHWH